MLAYLPKAMLESASETETLKSLMVQLAPSGDDISVKPAPSLRKINSFISWMEAWNVYPSIIISHTPSRAAELVAYQRIITSASIEYPPSAWLTTTPSFVHFPILH